MKNALTLVLLCTILTLVSCHRTVNTNPEIARIDSAVAVAKNTHRQVLCQMGGDWCKWCRQLNKEMAEDSVLSQFVDEHFVYIHVTYNGKDDTPSQELNERLQNAARFGFPVWVILDGRGNIVHIQNTAYLESGFGYDHQRLLDCLNDWK
ncbi:MAG: thioredoxin family protein [Paludibacteraceae bacterium]|nr:thioredoxin family protein [Paludibacteraceae bacterium]